MIDFPYISNICKSTNSKIVMLVADGLGGMHHPDYAATELETAKIPNLDKLASISSCGVSTPVLPGLTPGSGPGHMGLFGYDPIKYLLGRGILEGIGIDAPIEHGDVVARGNFCTLDEEMNILDRRAGRISNEQGVSLTNKLNSIVIDNVNVNVHHVMGYRFVLVFKGDGLSDLITDTDPQITGVNPLMSQAKSKNADKTANAVNEFVSKANALFKDDDGPANGLLLRGFSSLPSLPDFNSSYKLKSVAIASYPMYRGIANLMGMDVIKGLNDFNEEINALRSNFNEYDFFFLHYKPADSAGEDSNFEQKVKALEDLDSYIEEILDINPNVLVVCGDHSTPSYMGSHSWHPVPFIIKSQYSQPNSTGVFTELSCRNSEIGSIKAKELMFTVLAHAGKLNKFGP
ncbi:MAG: 2,3-bisphosphoglycerate-independent phosphoglycerate mutase [SAR202 cluster bacterium]|nr:phosphoglycerate mutase [Chloroflexota bacterium]MQG22656.1 2,3-bisphosphoglycerate-independent phosphoglycerate mutase [SAR202 cluster bacterium]|tara:strand:- start:7095 stop:8303 length:1209 start_codon:yes stop_codon:yes gene_type:complete